MKRFTCDKNLWTIATLIFVWYHIFTAKGKFSKAGTLKQKEGIGKIVSSSTWSIASVKKSILFDVLGVMDRANRIRTRRTLQFDYSLLKKETAEKYEKLYKEARNRSEWFAAAFYVPQKKFHGARETVIYSYLIAKAFDWVSYNCLEKWLKENTKEIWTILKYYFRLKMESQTGLIWRII